MQGLLLRPAGVLGSPAGASQGGYRNLKRRDHPPRGASRASCCRARVSSMDSAPLSALPPLKDVKGMLFDIDGTMTDSDPIHFLTFQDILKEQGYKGYNNGESISREFFDKNITGGHNSILSNFLWPERTQAEQDKFSDEKEARFRELSAGNLKPLPGFLQFLDWIKASGRPFAAVSNAPKANCIAMLKGIGATEYFPKIVLGEECVRPKPFPEPYLEGLKLIHRQPHECLAFEDSPSGATAAIKAGIPTVAILTSQTAEHMRSIGCCHCIKDYTELVALIPKEELSK
ncbi:hypothetical protein WJX84_010573 [Apatococcus fuscideae]|uniref:Haloacid dehalogenase-like hydrolase domain-containing protein Sgpp n=1 Tax=Apatococcus fuscideae TaxID=2026836 RepID=A0AAW1T3L9_9CHLO